MCEMKSVLIVVASLLAVTGFCIYQVNLKVGQHSEMKSESPCEKEYEEYCLNGDKCYYLDDEDNVGCNCTRFYGGKRCEKYMWWA